MNHIGRGFFNAHIGVFVKNPCRRVIHNPYKSFGQRKQRGNTLFVNIRVATLYNYCYTALFELAEFPFQARVSTVTHHKHRRNVSVYRKVKCFSALDCKLLFKVLCRHVNAVANKQIPVAHKHLAFVNPRRNTHTVFVRYVLNNGQYGLLAYNNLVKNTCKRTLCLRHHCSGVNNCVVNLGAVKCFKSVHFARVFAKQVCSLHNHCVCTAGGHCTFKSAYP
ncbi:MAG: hypothetical protein E7571_00550 [Ruminococcaceae bacterium]|nr:hypothetical protein [Oscillospiraceae bacterium]